jgi:hypothetical protein
MKNVELPSIEVDKKVGKFSQYDSISRHRDDILHDRTKQSAVHHALEGNIVHPLEGNIIDIEATSV